jgi:hypothetical protein
LPNGGGTSLNLGAAMSDRPDITIPDRRFSSSEMAIAIAKRLTGEAPVDGAWREAVAEHGIDLTDPQASDSAVYIDLENGQRFTVVVEEDEPRG